MLWEASEKIEGISLFAFTGYGMSVKWGHLRLEFGWRSNNEALQYSNHKCAKQQRSSFSLGLLLMWAAHGTQKRCFGMGSLWETYGKLTNRSAQPYLIFGCL